MGYFLELCKSLGVAGLDLPLLQPLSILLMASLFRLAKPSL